METMVNNLLKWNLCVAKLCQETVPHGFGSCGVVPLTCILSAQSTSHVSLSNAFTFLLFLRRTRYFKAYRGTLSNLGGWLGFITSRSIYIMVFQLREQGQDWMLLRGNFLAFHKLVRMKESRELFTCVEFVALTYYVFHMVKCSYSLKIASVLSPESLAWSVMSLCRAVVAWCRVTATFPFLTTNSRSPGTQAFPSRGKYCRRLRQPPSKITGLLCWFERNHLLFIVFKGLWLEQFDSWNVWLCSVTEENVCKLQKDFNLLFLYVFVGELNNFMNYKWCMFVSNIVSHFNGKKRKIILFSSE